MQWRFEQTLYRPYFMSKASVQSKPGLGVQMWLFYKSWGTLD